jgi:hypothetical protein
MDITYCANKNCSERGNCARAVYPENRRFVSFSSFSGGNTCQQLILNTKMVWQCFNCGKIEDTEPYKECENCTHKDWRLVYEAY